MTLALQGCALDEDDNASLAAKKAFLLVLELSGFDVGRSNSSSSGSKNVALEASVKNTRRIIRLKVAEIFKVKSDAFLKVLSVQVNRTCDAHYILVKKPAKMTGEARNVAADWLCRTKTRFLGIESRGESVGVFASNIVVIILRIRGRRRNVDFVPKR